MSEPNSDRYSLHVADESTLARVAALVGRVHGQAAQALTLSLARHFPMPVVVLWMRHDPTGEAVSTLSLIPWTWRLGATPFTVWETGIVATDEAHRGRGLSSRLMKEAEALRKRAGVAVSIIQGIPYFYRRYGYEFAVPLETHLEWELRHLPVPPQEIQRRVAEPSDAELLSAWFGDAFHELASVRSVDHWRYRLLHAAGTETEGQYLVVEGSGFRGGFCVARSGFGEGLIVNEVGGDPEAWPSLAAEMRQEAERRAKPYVRLHLGSRHPFGLWAQRQGARFTGSWHWQVKFDDPQAAFDQLAPEWRRRWPLDLPSRLVLDLYQGREVVLTRSSSDTGSVREARLSIPRELLPPFLLGWKPLAVLRETRPDLFGSPEALALAEALFPPQTGFCGSPY